MKDRFAVALIAALAGCAVSPAEEEMGPDASLEPNALVTDGVVTGGKRVFIIAGQSNAVGAARVTDLSPELSSYGTSYLLKYAQERECPTDFLGGPAAFSSGWVNRVTPYRTRFIGIEMSLGRRLIERFGTDIVLIKHATSGTNLWNEWEPDTESSLYDYFTTFVDARMAELPAGSRVAGLIWMQGNGDGNTLQPAKSYAGNLAYFINRFRDRYGDVPVLLESGAPLNAVAHGAIVRDRQARVAARLENVFVVDSSDLPLRDNAHYTADSYVVLGQRMADTFPAQ
jgi:hypothetical protein